MSRMLKTRSAVLPSLSSFAPHWFSANVPQQEKRCTVLYSTGGLERTLTSKRRNPSLQWFWDKQAAIPTCESEYGASTGPIGRSLEIVDSWRANVIGSRDLTDTLAPPHLHGDRCFNLNSRSSKGCDMAPISCTFYVESIDGNRRSGNSLDDDDLTRDDQAGRILHEDGFTS